MASRAAHGARRAGARRSSSARRGGRRRELRRIRSRRLTVPSAPSTSRRAPTRTSRRAIASCLRLPRCSPSPSSGTGWSSEALEAEALRRSDLVKTALLRAVSHDLRSPLTGIRTAVGALQQSDAAAQRRGPDRAARHDRRRLGAAEPARRRPARSLAPRGRRRRARARRSGRSTISSTRRSTCSARRDRVEVAGEAPLVNVDATQIQRVLANLIENALKFSPDGSEGPRAHHRDAHGGDRARRRPGPGARGGRARARLRAVLSPRDRHQLRRRPRSGDRARVRGRERRPRLGRVASRSGRVVRARAARRRGAGGAAA